MAVLLNMQNPIPDSAEGLQKERRVESENEATNEARHGVLAGD